MIFHLPIHDGCCLQIHFEKQYGIDKNHEPNFYFCLFLNAAIVSILPKRLKQILDFEGTIEL